jgi:hypothetical protein
VTNTLLKPLFRETGHFRGVYAKIVMSHHK